MAVGLSYNMAEDVCNNMAMGVSYKIAMDVK